MGVEDGIEGLADGRPLDLHLRLAAGRGAQLGRDLDGHCHVATASRLSSASKLATAGSISLMRKVSRVASRVFSPSPVITATTRSPAGSRPSRASLARTPIVTPPAVSVKIPVVSARSRMPARISSSVTESIDPPVSRAWDRAKMPSAGSPIARLLAIVLGRWGLHADQPSL